MSDVKSTTIIPIACYCLLLGVFASSLGINVIYSHQEILTSQDVFAWFPVIAYGIFACWLLTIGIGLWNENNLCWKMFFFFLVICVSSLATLIIVSVILFFINSNIIYSFFQSTQITPLMWFSFLSFFLSEIIVLYYLSSEDVVSSFGGMGEMLAPF